jgi:DNA-binding CsgD family transcriptional regulator
MRGLPRERALERIGRLAGRGLDVASFYDQAGEVLAATVPTSFDPAWVTLDPASLLITGAVGCDGPAEELVAFEYLEDDPVSTTHVVSSDTGIQTLATATGGDPSRSRAYREFMQPSGIGDYVEAALRTRTGETWGTVSLSRGTDQPRFDEDELAFLRAAAPSLAEGTRRGLLVGEATDPEGPEAPGLVVVDAEWGVESLTPGVERWLAELPGLWEDQGRLPPAIVAVAARALRTAEDADNPGEVAIARVLSREGRWILLHGAALVAGGTRRGAVIVEPAHPARITPLLMAAYGLTEREQDVTRLVLRGDSTAQIAASLFVSPHTVQQHLKGIFDKTGVRSRRELVGKVFFSHYQPRVLDNEQRFHAECPLRGGPYPNDAAAPVA